MSLTGTPPDTPPPAGPLLDACRRLAAAMDAFDEAIARRLGIGRSDLRALNLLEFGPLPAKALAEQLGLTRPAVTALVDRLEQARHVRRTPDPDDRRSRLVELRPAVWRTLATVYRPLGEQVARLDNDLEPSQRDQLAQHLHHIADLYGDARRT